MTRDSWLSSHEYLRPLARFCGQVEAAAAEVVHATAPIPAWEDYENDFKSGLPLLQSSAAAIDLEPAGRSVVALVERLASNSLAGRLAADVRALSAEIRSDAGAARRIASWLIGDRSFTPSSPGMLRLLGWTATARYLRPLVAAYAGWRNEDRWLRAYCPMCGSPPAMAQLIGIDPGRQRFLACGCCGTRWRYGRTGCPFCERDTHRIAVVAVEGEGGLRIDHCESCRGYLKTYDGQGNEALLLADWSSLHLDVAAQDRGLKRLATSLFEFDLGGVHALGSAAP